MITLHHLNFSRSSRVIWLLEELGLEYKLVSYKRTEQFRAPPELAKIHPLGKAPVIEDGDLVMAESGVILDYINKRYAAGRLAPPTGSREEAVHEEWLHYVESSAMMPFLLAFIGGRMGGLPQGLEQFAKASMAKTLDYVSGGVGRGPYLMGEQFTIADIQMGYLIEFVDFIGGLKDHKVLQDYLASLKARPAFAKTLEIGGPMTPGVRS